MLIIADKPGKLSFPRFLEVYAQESRREGAERYPEEPEARQIQLAEEDFRGYLTEVFFPTPGACCAVWEAEGRYVSALRLEPYQDGLLLEGLTTHPGVRRKGYASALVKAVQALPGVTVLYSHVDKDNRPSLALHDTLGFQVISRQARFIDGSVTSHALTLRWNQPE